MRGSGARGGLAGAPACPAPSARWSGSPVEAAEAGAGNPSRGLLKRMVVQCQPPGRAEEGGISGWALLIAACEHGAKFA